MAKVCGMNSKIELACLQRTLYQIFFSTSGSYNACYNTLQRTRAPPQHEAVLPSIKRIPLPISTANHWL